ncbi:AlpA family transcriptional regulator [Methylibium sp. Root1272]|jgi:prophage regulatory protein|uniref:helix-turn-helix transcriptional regulator n=1 Tax=Methylibium sp. Root1272 TaxID=1736441 RepID=UPI0009E89E0C|nr:AlpA family transcriptional regulator [Methylibium sp. Root1272]MBX9715294.1 AlpA family transcriptional regulator [Burkholderiaceae bacterium]
MERSLQATADLDDNSPSLLLRLPAVMKLTGLGRSTIYRMVSERRFPCPVRITKRAVAWRRVDLDQWSDTRPAATH